MVSVRRYKTTALTTVVVALVFIFGVSLVVDPAPSSSDRTWGIALLAAEVAAALGLLCLATDRLTVRVNQTLIVIGLITACAFAIAAMAEDFAFFVWVFGPLLVLALLALWLGIVNHGLQRELGQKGPS